MKERDWKKIIRRVILGILVFAALGIAWNMFFSTVDCENNWSCFNSRLAACEKTRFIGGEKMIFEYRILGENEDFCEVEVLLLQGELNNRDSMALEGKRMTCNLPKGVVMIPESNIGNCSGELKEGLQDLIIKKLHTYLVKNLGKLNLEVIDDLGISTE